MTDTVFNTPCVNVRWKSDGSTSFISLEEVLQRAQEIQDITGCDDVTRAQYVRIFAALVSRAFTVVETERGTSDPDELADLFWDTEWDTLVREYIAPYSEQNSDAFDLERFMQSPGIVFDADEDTYHDVRLSPERGGKGSSAVDVTRAGTVMQLAAAHWFAHGRVYAHDGDTAKEKSTYGINAPGLYMHALVEGENLADIILANVTDRHFDVEDLPSWELELDGGGKASPPVNGPISYQTRMYMRAQLGWDVESGVIRHIMLGKGDSKAEGSESHDVSRVMKPTGSAYQSSSGRSAISFGDIAESIYLRPPYAVAHAIGRRESVVPVSISGPVVGNKATLLRGVSTYSLPVTRSMLDTESDEYRAFLTARSHISTVSRALDTYVRNVLFMGNPPPPNSNTHEEFPVDTVTSKANVELKEILRTFIDDLATGRETADKVLRTFSHNVMDTASKTIREVDTRAPLAAHLPTTGSQYGSVSGDARRSFYFAVKPVTEFIKNEGEEK